MAPAANASSQVTTQDRRRALHHVLATAAQRGQIPPDTDLNLAIDLLAGPLFYRRLVTHQPPPPTYPTALVDHLLAALTPATPT